MGKKKYYCGESKDLQRPFLACEACLKIQQGGLSAIAVARAHGQSVKSPVIYSCCPVLHHVAA